MHSTDGFGFCWSPTIKHGIILKYTTKLTWMRAAFVSLRVTFHHALFSVRAKTNCIVRVIKQNWLFTTLKTSRFAITEFFTVESKKKEHHWTLARFFAFGMLFYLFSSLILLVFVCPERVETRHSFACVGRFLVLRHSFSFVARALGQTLWNAFVCHQSCANQAAPVQRGFFSLVAFHVQNCFVI